jgi:putative peptidoglycan lipid II flippase
LVILLPQIPFYVTAGTGAAVMNAAGRFALAAGAPALENAGMIATLVMAAVIFGTRTELSQVTAAQASFIAMGTTLSVAIHAAAQWFGASRSGVRLVPSGGWRDREIRRIFRRVVPTLTYTALAASQTLVVLVIANRLAGGLVAFQLALNFFFLPIAVVTWPIARSMLPRLARLSADQERERFWDELCRALRLALFVAIPIGVAYVLLAAPIARAIALENLEATGGDRLVAIALATLALGVIGETWFILGTYAFYAREDVGSPLRSMALRVAVALGCISTALLTRGSSVLLILGLAMSLGSVAGSAHLWRRLKAPIVASLPPRSRGRVSRRRR